MKKDKEKILNQIIGKTYQTGVILSMTITFIGLLQYIFFVQHQKLNFRHFITDNSFDFDTFRMGLYHLESTAIMLLGLLLLMFTPIARILLSIIAFILIRDTRYALVGLVTLTIIAIAITIGVFYH